MKDLTRPNIRLAIVEDQTLVQEGIIRSLETLLPIEVVARCASLGQIDAVRQQLASADVCLVDVILGAEYAFDGLPQIQAALPGLKWIWVTGIDQEFLVTRALDSGLPGFVHKDDSASTLAAAIEQVVAGGRYVSERVQRMANTHRTKPDFYKKLLTDREQQILGLIGRGLSNDEAASILGLSPGTLQAHRRNLMLKLNLHSAAELQAYALKSGFASSHQLK